MPRDVRADFVDMHLSAKRLDDWRLETSEVFDHGHRELELAASGWVGESAAALADAAVKIRKAQQALTTRLADHSSGISSVAHVLEQQDALTRNSLLKFEAATSHSLNLGV